MEVLGLEKVVQDEAKPGNFLADVDCFCVSDNYYLGRHKPCVTYGLRGLAYFHVTVEMGSKDLHSGVFGGTVHEAMTDVAMLMTKLVDANGKILIPGIYDDVDPVTQEEKDLYGPISFNLDEYAEELGLPSKDPLVYQTNEEALMHRWRFPSLSMHGIEHCFSGPGERTVIPHKATLKFSIRLVPSQTLDKVAALVEKFLKDEFAALSSGNHLTVEMVHGARPWLGDYKHPNYNAAISASRKVHGIEPDLTREGASIPVVLTLEEATGKSVCLLPVGASDDGAHSSDEKFNVTNYMNGIKTLGMYLEFTAMNTVEGEEY